MYYSVLTYVPVACLCDTRDTFWCGFLRGFTTLCVGGMLMFRCLDPVEPPVSVAPPITSKLASFRDKVCLSGPSSVTCEIGERERERESRGGKEGIQMYQENDHVDTARLLRFLHLSHHPVHGTPPLSAPPAPASPRLSLPLPLTCHRSLSSIALWSL